MANETSKTSETPSTNKVTLSGNVLEKLYQRYSIKQRRAGLECFLAASILFDLWAIFVPQGQSWESLGLTCVFLLFNLLVIIFIKIFKRSKHRGSLYDVTPLIAWIIAIVQLFLQLFLKGAVTPRDSLGWAILLNFLVYVSLPIPLKYTGILFGVGSYTLHLSTTLVLPKKDEFFIQQQFTNALLMITAASIGLLCYFMGEAKHKRAFLEAKQSLEVKMVIEEQSAEQITSILPEHVAVKMRQDLGSDDSEQFKKIYMSRHENVSILYADIVGFTAISSTYSAQDLVKMLNELFARFDRLAEKYQQLRIKILGDCYYCISGAPVERPDHAVLCVHMGLSMVKAIKYVQKKANSPVDMRVGIHTGAILAGILGQRQWQFDVYSKDVELANKMESSGMAGRVHISEKTLGFLSGEFEVEPAFGEKREEALRIAGLKTYFIKKVLKPFVSTNSEHTNGLSKIDTDGSIKSDCPSISSTEDDEKTHATGEYDVAESLPDKEDDFKQRLKKELLSRDRHGELSKDTTIFLTFKNKELEKSYSAHKQPLSAIPLVASPSWLHFCISLSPIFLVLLFVTATVGETLTEILPDSICMASKKFNNVVCLRRFAAIVIIFSVGFSNILDMCTCTLGTIPLAGGNYTFNITTEPEIFPSTVCLLFPSYFSNYAVLILIATSLVAQLSHICKICIMIVIAGMHCGVNIFLLDEYFRAEEYHTWNARLPIYYSLSALLVAVTIALGFLTRHFVSTNSEHTNGLSKIDTDGSIKSDCPSISSTEDDEKTHATGEYDVAESLPDKEDDFKQRLKKELLSRDRHGELSKDTTIFLTFKNKELEKSYSAHKQPLSAIPLVASPSWLHFCISLSPIFLVLLFVTATVGETLTEILPDSICMASKKFNNVVCLRRFAAIVIIFSVGFSNILDMCTCTLGTIPLAGGNYTFNITTEPEIFPSTVCLLFPSYFSNYAVLILIATSLVAQLSHICKICIMIVIAGMHCGVNIFLLDEYFRAEEYHTWNARLPIYYSLSALLVAVTIALGFLTRHMDKEDRVIFKWRNEVNEQREKASDMRRRNEALVYNILPVHVAEHFMRNKQRSYDQLYSQSYEEVGVLFASMPNFSDFYSEDTVNNQGLECLRFLNEVISDFDALLELPKYQDVNKIKTIGSTYMAASGLNPVTRVKPDDPVVIRWEHLSILVEFALELKKALQCINEQSFNHFVLKMGINHGPITAGVIGARKPHYDIWGNTVNVASRMESTGKAGAIQVTEETCEILQTFGYTFEQRGLVAVKGKGQLMTYYLQGKTIRQNSIHSSPILAAINPMETLPEMDESKESTPPNETSGSMIPSISSSSNSPNSVKVNQTYLRSQPNQSAQNETTSIELNVTKINTNDVENENVDNLSMASNDNITLVICSGNNTILDMDNEASTPLLDAKNSTNSNAINSDYSDSEKEALIFSSNSLS